MKLSMGKNASLVLHTIGIYIFFLVFGIYGEKLTTTAYNGRRYDSALFPSMLQSLGGVMISRVMMSCNNITMEVKSGALLHQYAYLAILGLVSSRLGFTSLKYLSYPTLLIAKSCKLIPIALMNFLIYRKILSHKRCLWLALTSVSVLSFTLFGKQSSSTGGSGALGIPILVTSLLLDGIVNSIQDYIFEEFKVSVFHMMYYISLIKFFTPFTVILLTDNLRYSIVFMSRTPDVILDLFLYSTFNVLGQVVIYLMVQSHGSLVLTTVNLTRKMFSILLSLVLFGHKIKRIQVLSVLGVFASIALEVFEPKKPKRLEK
jgi:solute carrier family 35 (UDP-galactose transporter), member B1